MSRQSQTQPTTSIFVSLLFSLLICSVLFGIGVTGGLLWYEAYPLAAITGSATVGMFFVLHFFVASLKPGGKTMNEEQQGPSPAAQLGMRLITMLIIAIVAGALFTWLFIWIELYILAGIVGTASVALLLTLIVTIASLFSSSRTMKIMREGAEIAIAAMSESEVGRNNTQLTKTFADIFASGVKTSNTQQKQFYPGNGQPANLPALPLPSQDVQAWMPPISTMTIEGEQEPGFGDLDDSEPLQ